MGRMAHATREKRRERHHSGESGCDKAPKARYGASRAVVVASNKWIRPGSTRNRNGSPAWGTGAGSLAFLSSVHLAHRKPPILWNSGDVSGVAAPRRRFKSGRIN